MPEIGSRGGARVKTVVGSGSLLLLQLAGTPAMGDAGCKVEEVASIPADFSRGVPIIEVGINGQTVNFLLSTGSNMTRINEAVVKRLALPEVDFHQRALSANGTKEQLNALVQDFTIGKMASHTNTFTVSSKGGDGSAGTIAGVMGLDYLGNYDIELDPTEHRVNLFSPIRCESAVYWWDDHFELPITLDSFGFPTVKVTLDGHQYSAVVSTNSLHSTIDIVEAHRHLEVPDTIQISSPESDTPEYPIYSFKDLVFGPITLRNPKIQLIRYKAVAVETGSHLRETLSDENPMSIGMVVLGKFHTLISFGSGKIYFTLPNERKPVPAATPKP